jgi:hypothetical protein
VRSKSTGVSPGDGRALERVVSILNFFRSAHWIQLARSFRVIHVDTETQPTYAHARAHITVSVSK